MNNQIPRYLPAGRQAITKQFDREPIILTMTRRRQDTKLTKIVSIGDRVFPGDYSFHSRFRKAVNFIDEEKLVAVVTGEVGKGPANIVVLNIDLAGVNALAIDEESIFIDGVKCPFDKQKIFNSRIAVVKVNAERLTENLRAFENALLKLSPSKSLAFLLDPAREANFTSSFEKKFLERVKKAVRAVFNDIVGAASSRDIIGARCPSHSLEVNFIEGIKQLRGLGFGLTPSGDDFIAGLLAGMNLMEKIRGVDLEKLKEKACRAAQGGNRLSNSFITLAKDGFLFERFQQLVFSLIYENKNQVFENTKNLLDHGETSGSDMGVGFFLTLKSGLSSSIISQRQFA